MSLQFYFGPSGAGKSRKLYEEIIRRGQENPKTNFLVIVPDQFTMQTQKELVTLSDRGGIMNIDVLSFGRLTHRILEEVGGLDIPVLDDTGKSLVLQKVAAGMKEELPLLGAHLHRQGYIHEVKSAISEFMQYGLAPGDVEELIQFAGKRGGLCAKLKDLKTLYEGFLSYIQGNFITTEERLDVLRRSMHKSRILPGSVVAFDGFTGFTPIQIRVIEELLGLCGEVIVTVTMGEGENPYELDEEQKLFHMSKKLVAQLQKQAEELGVERKADVFVTPSDETRFGQAPALRFLEEHLFRYPQKTYPREGESPQEEIRLLETTTPKEEMHQVGLEICRLVREEGLQYRDIAVITSNMESYACHAESEFGQMEIPCYIDATKGIGLNPMIEYIKSALELFSKDFSYQAVFHYLRSGLADMTMDEVDLFENYILQTGIRGYRSYSRLFTHKTPQMGEDEASLTTLNELRERFTGQVVMLQNKAKETTVAEYVNGLYEFLVHNEVQKKLRTYEKQFEAEGNATLAKEYAQIYRLVMELLEQIFALLGDETISLRDFIDILEAGIQEIQVGTIPQNVDRVLVGDMERSRLKQVKVLFFMGVNDGNIPRNASKGGIISDMDRLFLQDAGKEMAPGSREQMYIQRFYLYLNLTKPSRRLYLSYSRLDNGGTSLRPAYLVGTMKKMFPGLWEEYPEKRPASEQIVTAKEGLGYLAKGLRDYVDESMEEERLPEFLAIYYAYGAQGLMEKRNFLTQAAFKRYREGGISSLVAKLLYGVTLHNSVSRLETYAACAYRQFLQYGLSLKERQELSLEAVDLGNVFHEVLERFARNIEAAGYTWFDFPEAYGEQAVTEELEKCAATYGDVVLYQNARNEYAITRMDRILKRTVKTLQQHLRKGAFEPAYYELGFRQVCDLESVDVSLSEQERLHLVGKIDRVDICNEEDRLYVKVIDYKSGDKDFDVVALYHGLQLQLVVYMNAAMEAVAKEYPDKEVVPAAMLYYQVTDPMVERKGEMTPEEIQEAINAALRTKGVVNSASDIIEKLDGQLQGKSSVIPVKLDKTGAPDTYSHVMGTQELKRISDYVNLKIRNIGKEILNGNITMNPYEFKNRDACEYCPYKKVCGYDPALPGCGHRHLESLDQEEVLQRMGEWL
ncbi:MAG: exodeoxyribonuclease V subunit gamma [Lachnospiraceae bacterium]|nr:exodeoxyribonuclease V subunit gamma [Lachnospiraceae bacterium]